MRRPTGTVGCAHTDARTRAHARTRDGARGSARRHAPPVATRVSISKARHACLCSMTCDVCVHPLAHTRTNACRQKQPRTHTHACYASRRTQTLGLHAHKRTHARAQSFHLDTRTHTRKDERTRTHRCYVQTHAPTHKRTRARTHRLYILTDVCARRYVYADTHADSYIRTYIHTFFHSFIHTYRQTDTDIHTFIHTSLNAYSHP